MKGYHQRPEATAETIDKDGWLHTGDIGYYDERGYIFIADRIKELIKVKGFQVIINNETQFNTRHIWKNKLHIK